jgi:hypothetical protein
MVDLWFGDSWVVGAELGDHYGEKILSKKFFPCHHRYCRGDLAFPALVSNHRKTVHFNLGLEGGSYNFAYHQLIKFCKKNPNNLKGATVFLCTTGQTRDFALDLMNREHHFLPHVAEIMHKPEHKSDIQYAIYDSTVILNAFYHACCFYGLKLFVIPVWCIFEENAEVYAIPDEVWLKPRNQIIFNEIAYPYPIVSMEPNSGDTSEILYKMENNNLIRPCSYHPNKQGHEKIAAKIIDLLNTHK